MSQSNDITVRSYDEEYQVYVDKTANQVTGSIKDFIDNFLGAIPANASILEIGSGTGRDADYIQNLGYDILRTDAAQGFVGHMTAQGHEAKRLNIVKEALDEKFDAILANAVFLHFDEEDFAKAITNVKAMLKNDGVFALSLHKGTFIGMSDHKHKARYFHEWGEDQIISYLSEQGFKVLKSLPGESITKRKIWILLITQLVQK